MDSCGTTSKEQGTTDFRCVQCGFPIKTLYIQYSPGNIRLMKCGNCKAVADEYIECEVMSVLWKSVLAYLLLDIYRMWVLRTNEKEWPSRASVASLLLEFGKMLAGVILGNLIFLCVVFHATRKFLRASTGFYGWKQIVLVVLVSSYFKIFLMAMMVWEFPSSVIFIIDIFVISSNIVALKGAEYGYG
ncbi:UNVERIFIED_CONTAM: protein ARV 1 [Sesamum radiatum]|uniref:Protein ARV n=1 Tax=Sesamum radiatum TaxID=300843 RepID=A0AAW2V388_SESRA